MPGGAPIKYTRKRTKEIAKAMIEFFDIDYTQVLTETITTKNGGEKVKEIRIGANFPTIISFCRKEKFTKDTLHRLIKQKKENGDLVHPELSDAYKRAKEIQEDIWLNNSLNGHYNAQFAIFAGKNIFNYKDKSERDLTTGGKPMSALLDELEDDDPQQTPEDEQEIIPKG